MIASWKYAAIGSQIYKKVISDDYLLEFTNINNKFKNKNMCMCGGGSKFFYGKTARIVYSEDEFWPMTVTPNETILVPH